MSASQKSKRGLTLAEVCLVIATIALVGLFILPMIRPRSCHGPGISCVNNLKLIGLAFRLYAGDHDDKYPFALTAAAGGTKEFINSPDVSIHYEVMSNEIVSPKILVCRMDPKRTRTNDFLAGINNSNLSYFVGLDADEAKPERLLSGDRNITGGSLRNGFLRLLTPTTPAGWTSEIHQNAGNIGLADGSVMQTDPLALRRQLQSNTLAVIRLAIP